MKPEQADQLTRKHTAFQSFDALIDATMKSGYFPTLQALPVTRKQHYNRIHRNTEMAALADEYDRSMERLGMHQRAWRGSNAKKV